MLASPYFLSSDIDQKYISEMIHERTKNYRDFSDLFSNLIEANENDDEGLRLTTPEMMGNIFIFLIGTQTLVVAALLLMLYGYSWARDYWPFACICSRNAGTVPRCTRIIVPACIGACGRSYRRTGEHSLTLAASGNLLLSRHMLSWGH